MILRIDSNPSNIYAPILESSNSGIGRVLPFKSTGSLAQLNRIQAIQVDVGPGSGFARTRLGVVIGNALAFALGVPINQKKFVIPVYQQAPHISQPRRQ